jgi:hypothetical protein
MLKVMFLCTGNSCRSQMAEGFARELGKGLITAHSAGLSPQSVNPKAVAVMKEIGIDISQQQSKAIAPELLDKMAFFEGLLLNHNIKWSYLYMFDSSQNRDINLMEAGNIEVTQFKVPADAKISMDIINIP